MRSNRKEIGLGPLTVGPSPISLRIWCEVAGRNIALLTEMPVLERFLSAPFAILSRGINSELRTQNSELGRSDKGQPLGRLSSVERLPAACSTLRAGTLNSSPWASAILR